MVRLLSTTARFLHVVVTNTHAEGGRGETCKASPVRTTSHARAVAPVLLSPLGGAYCGRHPARAAVEQASLGEEKREGVGVGGGVLTRRVTPKPTSERPARGETTGLWGPAPYTHRTAYIL